MYTISVGKARCPVCSTGLDCGSTVVCPRCLTPHHSDCWIYAKGCSIYGCKAVKKAVEFRTLAEAADGNSIGYRRIKDWFSLIVLQWLALYGIVTAFSLLVQTPIFKGVLSWQEFELFQLVLGAFTFASIMLYLITFLPRLSAWYDLKMLLQKPRVAIEQRIQFVHWVDKDGWRILGDRLLLTHGLISFLVYVVSCVAIPAQVTGCGYCVILSIGIVILGCKASADRYNELKRVQALVDEWQRRS